MLELLVKSGADPNIDSGSSTPLLLAADYGAAGIIRLLIRLEASAEAVTFDNENVLHFLARHDEAELLKELVQQYRVDTGLQTHSAGRAPIHFAAMYGQTSAARVLLELGAGVSVPDSKGETPLQLAARFGHAEVLAFLLAKGAKLAEANLQGETAVHIASELERWEILELCRRNSAFEATASIRNSRGHSALHLAAMSQSILGIELLSAVTAKCDYPSKTGRTPAHIARRFGSAAGANLLARNGATFGAQDKAGHTPADYHTMLAPPCSDWSGKLGNSPLGQPCLWVGTDDYSSTPAAVTLALWADGAGCIYRDRQAAGELFETSTSSVVAMTADLFDLGYGDPWLHYPTPHGSATVVGVEWEGNRTLRSFEAIVHRSGFNPDPASDVDPGFLLAWERGQRVLKGISDAVPYSRSTSGGSRLFRGVGVGKR
jgi:ankyrin repeat protein